MHVNMIPHIHMLICTWTRSRARWKRSARRELAAGLRGPEKKGGAPGGLRPPSAGEVPRQGA